MKSNLRLAVWSTFGGLILGAVYFVIDHNISWIEAYPILSFFMLFGVAIALILCLLYRMFVLVHRYEIQIETLNVKNEEYNIRDINVNIDPNKYLKSIENIVVVHNTLHAPELMAHASCHILLHAAYYPRYGIDSTFSSALLSALKKNRELKVKVIVTDIGAKWALEFAKVLRFEFNTLDNFKQGIEASLRFFYAIKHDFPNNVEIVSSKVLPLAPIVIIDNNILVGHYAHAEVNAPDGYWMHIKNDKITDMLRSVSLNENYTAHLSAEEKAISRYIEDFHFAFMHSKICDETMK